MKRKKRHILVISQYFYPEQFRINDICKEWVNRNYQVTVITGIPNYPAGKYYKGYGLLKKRKEFNEGIEIIRLPLIPRGNRAITLALNYISFVVSGFFWKCFTKIEADCVFIFEVSPMTQALPGVWYAKKWKTPCYLYVQDLWPENVEIITGITNKNIISSIGKMVDYIYKHCTRIFTTSNSFVSSIHQRGVPLEKLEYWPQYAEDFYQPLEKVQREDEMFQIVFAGNIGNAQGLDILPKVAQLLKERKQEKLGRKVKFNIIGDGRYKDTFLELIKAKNVEEMFHFFPKQPAEEIPKAMAANDGAFLCLIDNPFFAMTIPAKLQSYLACGIPIIASANGETMRIIKEAKAGAVSAAGDEKELAEKICELVNATQEELELLGQQARKYYEKHFDKKMLMDRMDQYLMDIKLANKKDKNYV